MDPLEYRAQAEARQDANRMNLGLLAFLFFVGSLGCFGAASVKTQTKSSGHLFWKDETVVAVPTEQRLAWLGAGLLLMVVAVVLALILYRISHGRAVPPTASGDGRQPVTVSTGQSKEFWIQTAIAVVGLVVATVSAAAAWRG